MAKRHTAPGITKVCGCATGAKDRERAWARCEHSYYLSFRYRNGKHWRLSLDKIAEKHLDKSAAKTLADELRTKIRKGEFQVEPAPVVAEPTPAAVTFKAFGELWMEREREGTIADWKSDTSRLTKLSAVALEDSTLGARPIGRITLDDLETVFKALKATGITGQTLNKYLQVLMHLQRWGVRKGYLGRPWFDRDSQPAKRAAVARRSRRLVADVLDANGRIVEDGEEKRLLAVAGPWLQRLIIAALETGCRRGELLKLQWKHVDMTRGRLNLPAEMTKTKEGRIVVISARLRPVLEMVRVNPVTDKPHKAEAFVFGNAEGEAVANPKKSWEVCVLKAHGHTPQWRKGRSNGLAAASRAALAEIDLHWHDLRHEAGSRWIESGHFELHQIQKMLGHANLSQTSTYLNATQDGIEAAMKRMDAARGFLQSVAIETETAPVLNRNDDAPSAAKVLVN